MRASFCRHNLLQKRALPAEIDRANRASAADRETNRNSLPDKHLAAA